MIRLFAVLVAAGAAFGVLAFISARRGLMLLPEFRDRVLDPITTPIANLIVGGGIDTSLIDTRIAGLTPSEAARLEEIQAHSRLAPHTDVIPHDF